MPRRLISILAAAAIAFGALAPAPVLAQEDQRQESNPNTAAWMLGIATAAIIASKIRESREDDDDDDDDKKRQKPRAAPAKSDDARTANRYDRDWWGDDDRRGRGVGHWFDRGEGHDRGRGRGHDRAGASNRLPDRCITRNAAVRVYGQDCMSANYRFARALPDRCLVTFEGGRRGYVTECLERHGFLREED